MHDDRLQEAEDLLRLLLDSGDWYSSALEFHEPLGFHYHQLIKDFLGED